MRTAAKITWTVSTLVVAALAASLSACSAPAADQAASASESRTVASEPTPTPAMTELPEWATELGQTWIIYPVGAKCTGTEGCGNDFRAMFGPEVPWPLPAQVEYFGGPFTQTMLAQGFNPLKPGEEGAWSEEDLEHLAELGYPTELPLAPVE